MAPALSVSPAEVQVGDAVTISGTGFDPHNTVAVSIPEYGERTEIVADASGAFSGVDLADKATATLTSDGTVPTAADTVTIGAVTYTFRASVSTTANEILIATGGTAGENAAATLANLKAAINLEAGAGTKYGSATVVHPTVGAGDLTATTLELYAKTGGTGGNTLASTEASTHLSFADTTFADTGAAASGIDSLIFYPTDERPFTVVANDGVNGDITTTVKVFTQ